ncbi:MAG: hypothetical protein HFK06_01490 [Clostridia bacterium]|uniref:hypothetical protein n=1 Tax=Dubosiella newyorkensis TaxID=1862672 RepID=UPI0025AD6EB5|nr:hypothetical protein [Dubosiella newyorkensis]MCI9407011.1 hypothetical protein [Clostridia bacterium]
MKTEIYCKSIANGKQEFNLRVGQKSYLLFIQSYRASNHDYFKNGKPLTIALGITNVRSWATRKTIEKLLPAIKYIEKEYDIAILDRTLKKDCKKKSRYNRNKIKSRNFELLTA